MSKGAPASDRRGKSVYREYAEAIAIALVLAFFVRAFIVQAFKIPSGSMEDTLLVGDHILVTKFLYWFRDPKRGDIIVFRFPQDESRDFIKRVVGLPEEEVMVRGKKVYVNCITPDQPERCTPLPEKYAIFKPSGEAEGREAEWGPEKVTPGHLLVFGDNRNNSQDSRSWGFLRMGRQLGHIRINFLGLNIPFPFPCSLWSAPCWDDKIRGVAFVIYWSWNAEAGSVRWGRLGKLLE